MAFLNIMFELFVTNFCICESFEIENSIFTRKLSVWPNWCIGWRLEPSTLEKYLTTSIGSIFKQNDRKRKH